MCAREKHMSHIIIPFEEFLNTVKSAKEFSKFDVYIGE